MRPRPMLDIHNTRIKMALKRFPGRLASLHEYANAAGVPRKELVAELKPLLQQGVVSIERVGREAFLQTAPQGRPAPQWCPDIPPSRWEVLRRRLDAAGAVEAWKLALRLEQSGWIVKSNLELNRGMQGHCLYVIVQIDHEPIQVPLVWDAPSTLLGRPGGVLSNYVDHEPWIALVVPDAEIDEAGTEVRLWHLSRLSKPTMSVVLIPEPSHIPIVMRPTDQAIAPRSVAEFD